MTEFFTPIDIANRALQHCGANRLNATLGFTEVSKNASETSFAYGKLRRSELRRNVWRFATRRTVIRPIDPTTMLLAPAMWSPQTTYFVGSVVSDATGNLWISNYPNNLGNDPQSSLTWDSYFGPLTVSLYATGMSYSSGELVYTAPGDGTSRIYLSLQNNNQDTPATPTAYSATAVYMKNQVVLYSGISYMSLIDLNTGNTPNLAPLLYNPATTYNIGNKVGASDGVIYQSLSNGNLGNDPTTDNGVHWQNTGVLNPWTTVFVSGVGSTKWRQIGGAEFPMGVGLRALDIVYPLGSGPSNSVVGRYVYRLPSGYLRVAPQEPGTGIGTWLGGPSGITYSDWSFEGDFLTTSQFGPINFRFVADITNVISMDDMFCEGLAARMGMEICETVTQSTAKLSTIARVYDEWMSTARTVNGIEVGADEPPQDDYVSVRY